MIVWVVTLEDIDEGTKICDSISIFYSLKKAKAYFTERVNSYKEDTAENEDYIIEEDEQSFELWKDGYWCSDHVCITLEKHTVQ